MRDQLKLVKDDQGNPIEIVGSFSDISDRKQAEQTIRQQAEKEILLRQITQNMRQTLDLQSIFDTACQEIRQFIQTDRVAIFKFYPEFSFDDGEFVAESLNDGFSSVLGMRVQDHCFGENHSELYVKGHFQAISDVLNSNLQACHIEILQRFQIRANLVMPLLRGEELWGLLCIQSCTAPRIWQADEIDLIQQITGQLAIAIQQADLFDKIRQEQAKLLETNQKLALSNEELARATRLKDEFLANMSHELRTPLNGILGMAETLQEQVLGSLNEKQLKFLKTIEKSGLHLLSLINDVLDLAKIGAGQLALDCTLTAIAPLCRTSLIFIQQQAFSKNIQLQTQISENLPDLWIDERRIRQVLINLLNNAVKFTPAAGQISLTVTHFLPERTSLNIFPQGFLRIAITDTGIGIAPEDCKKLFQPFIQIDSSLTRQYEGTGLGLALVKHIVELHGGQVNLSSELGKGSCFSFDLPCTNAVAVLPPIPISPLQNLETVSMPQAQSPLILLAEDNSANVFMMSSYLEAKGYRLISASNGKEAIALAQAEKPDLILMDIQMPVMNGFEATQQIRLDPNLVHVPIIALTALAMEGDRDRCLEAGADEYLSKPVNLKQLAQLIQQLLTSPCSKSDYCLP